MSVHHLNCGTLHPRGTGFGRLAPTEMVCHCLLVERPDGLLLVDSGFGSGDIADPRRLGRAFVTTLRPDLSPAETAAAHVRRLGLDPADVRDIALTHLDLDHAGGIADFPNARVHVSADELAAARHPRGLNERSRYVAAQWAHDPHWVPHETEGDDWFGFRAVRSLGDDVVLIPLPGHTRGHQGVAVRYADGWILHAGDSYFSGGELETPPRFRLGLVGFQKAVAVDERRRRDNQARLRALRAEHPEVTIFSAHDAGEWRALAQR